MIIAVYIAEIAPTNIRGILVNMYTMFATLGLLVGGIAAGLFSDNRANGWRLKYFHSKSDSYLICFLLLFSQASNLRNVLDNVIAIIFNVHSFPQIYMTR